MWGWRQKSWIKKKSPANAGNGSASVHGFPSTVPGVKVMMSKWTNFTLLGKQVKESGKTVWATIGAEGRVSGLGCRFFVACPCSKNIWTAQLHFQTQATGIHQFIQSKLPLQRAPFSVVTLLMLNKAPSDHMQQNKTHQNQLPDACSPLLQWCLSVQRPTSFCVGEFVGVEVTLVPCTSFIDHLRTVSFAHWWAAASVWGAGFTGGVETRPPSIWGVLPSPWFQQHLPGACAMFVFLHTSRSSR